MEATPQLLVPPPPSALSERWPPRQPRTRGGQHPLRMMWEDYPPQGQQYQDSPAIPPKDQGRNCSRGACQLPSLLGQVEQPRGVLEVHCVAIGVPCLDGQ